eukprot:s2043_g1.t1
MRSLAVACVVALAANVAANARALSGSSGASEFFHTDGAWAMLKDGRVTTWGDPGRGGDLSSSSVGDMSGVQSVVATKSAFAALKADGSVISWGKASEGGDSRAVNLDSVVKLAASAYAFAALRADGGVVFWGKLSADESDEASDEASDASSSDASNGEDENGAHGTAHLDSTDSEANSEGVTDAEDLENLEELDSGVVDVIASSEAFACIKEDGTVYTWDGDLLKKVYDGDSPVVDVVGGLSSFAALTKDGSVLTWGHPEFGGNSRAVRSHLQSGVLRLERRSIFDRGFIAWKANSTAVIWGHNKKGVPLESQIVPAQQVQLRHTAGAVLRPDGSAFCFGDPKTFGDSSSVDLSNLRSILCPRFACVAIKKDGSIVTWGQRLGRRDPPKLQNVFEVFGTPYSFAALIRTNDIPGNDRIVAWGDSQSGGRTDYPKKLHHLEVFEVKAIHSHFDGSNNGVFIAEVRGQDSRNVLHAWGDPRYGALVADVSERSSERSQRSLQTSATCLSSAVTNRKDVVTVHAGQGKILPVGIVVPTWDSAMILSAIVKVLIEEVLGYHAVLQEGSGFMSTEQAFAAMAGCDNPSDYPNDQTGCSAGSTESHVLMEGWIDGNVDAWNQITSLASTFAPLRASKIYRSYEGLYVSKGVWDLKTTSPALDTKEALQSSQNPHDYFDDITAFSSTQLAACTATILVDRTIMATYVNITGDTEGVDASGDGTCYNSHWWLAPGSCRDLNGAACVPVITGGDGWMMPAFMQKSAIWGLQLAIGVAATWADYLDLAANKMCLFYWWEPDISFIELEPKRIEFPTHDASAWANQNYATSKDNFELDTVVSYDLQAVAPEVYTFISNFVFSIDDMRVLLRQRKSGATIDSLACSWVTNNEIVWRSNATTQTMTTTTTWKTMTTNTVTSSISSTITVSKTTSTSSTMSSSKTSSSTVTRTTSTSSSITTSSTTTLTTTITTSSMTSSSSTVTISSSTTMTRSSTTTSTTLLQSVVMPSNVDPDEPQGSVVLATLQGALAALNSAEDSVVLETAAGNVTVLKLSSASLDPSSSLVFQFGEGGEQATLGTIAVSVPVSLVSQIEQGGNVMLAVTQVNQDVTESFSDGGAANSKVVLSAPILEISFIQEASGEVTVANVSGLAEPVIFRLQDASPFEGDECVFFDLDTNSWSTDGVSVANSSQIAQVTGALSNGTWCATTHFSLFSSVQTVPFHEVMEMKDYLISSEDYMIAVALMLVVFVPICAMFCTWAFFRVQAPTSGKTRIKDDRGMSHVVKFTRSEVVAEGAEVAKAQTWKSGRSGRSDKEKTKVLVTWDVEPAEILQNLDHMKGHGWVAMDVGQSPRVMEKKSLKDLRGQSKEFPTVSQELRKASQEDDWLEEAEVLNERPEADMDPAEALAADIVEVSLDELTKVREMYQDREPVNYWSATHEMLMQAFISGRATLDESNEPRYDVLVGPRKQRREQVSCRLLSPAFTDGEPIFYEEGDGKKRTWRKGFVVQVVHAKGVVEVQDIDVAGDLEGANASSALSRGISGFLSRGDIDDPDKAKDVPFSRVCRRYVNDSTVEVYKGIDEGWQPAIIEQVEDSTEFSPREVTMVQVRPTIGGDPVFVQTCFIRNTKDGCVDADDLLSLS